MLSPLAHMWRYRYTLQVVLCCASAVSEIGDEPDIHCGTVWDLTKPTEVDIPPGSKIPPDLFDYTELEIVCNAVLVM